LRKYPFENGLNPPDGKGVSAPMMMLGFEFKNNKKRFLTASHWLLMTWHRSCGGNSNRPLRDI